MSDDRKHDAGQVAGAQPPVRLTGLRLAAPAGKAGGLAAVQSSMAHVWGEAGVVRGTKILLKTNQPDGFDCMGCAWPDPDADERSRFEFCENGAKAVAEETTTRRVDAGFFARHPVAELGGWSDFDLGKAGRLTQPMIKRPGAAKYEPIAWADAFSIIGENLKALASPNEAVFYTSGRTSNEAAFLYQLFVREFGTNNLPDCSHLCHESSGRGLTEVIGIGKGTVKLADFERADAIFVIGQNPGTNHPRMLSALQRAARNGAKIVSINPLKEAGLTAFVHPQEMLNTALGRATPLAKWHLPVRINGDVALLKGIMKEMLAIEDAAPGTVIDRDFIAAHTAGFDEFLADLRATAWDEIVEGSGVSRERIREAAQIAATSRATIVCWAMGLTQHKNAVGNVQSIANLLLMRGHFGKPGAGACPVRGHSNVQGDRTVGIVQSPKPAFLDALANEFGFDPPRENGFDVVAAIEAMHAGTAKVFISMGGNFLSATPDTEFTARALSRCALTVQISTKLNRSHVIAGATALILPALGRTETDVQANGKQFVTVENSMGIVHASRGSLAPASPDLRSEPAIVAGMAMATLGENSRVPWADLIADYDRIRARIERVIPGFENYNIRARQPGGFYLPNPVRDARQFPTADGKAHFTVHAIPTHNLGAGEFLMMTVRSHDQYNTTIYGLDDRYRGIFNERRVVLLNPADIAESKLAAGQQVDLTSHWQGETRVAERFVVVAYDVPRRSAVTYFPEANVLVPVRHFADGSRTPASKSVVITLSPSRT